MQPIRCRCGPEQWSNADNCGACGSTLSAVHHQVASTAQQPRFARSAEYQAPQVPTTIRTVAAGRRFRVGGFLAVALGTVLGVGGLDHAGRVFGAGGFIAFVVGRLME
jgi:hypothetical protein